MLSIKNWIFLFKRKALKDTLDHQNRYDIMSKLEDLHARGIEFQSNSDGPFILAAWTENEACNLSEIITGISHDHEEGLKGA